MSLPSPSGILSELRINTSRSRSASLVETQPRIATAVLGRVAPAWEVTARQTRDRRLRLSTRGDGIATPAFPGILRSGKRVPLRAAEGHALPVRHGIIRVESPSKSTSWAIGGPSLLRGAAHKGKAVGRHVGVWKGATTGGAASGASGASGPGSASGASGARGTAGAGAAATGAAATTGGEGSAGGT